MPKDWIPTRYTLMRDWCQNFIEQGPAIAAKTKVDLTPAIQSATQYISKIDAHEAAQTAASAASATFTDQRTETTATVRATAKLLKATPGVTVADLELLRMIGAESDPTARVGGERPELSLTLTGGHVVVKFKKSGHQGILLYCRRGAETEFTFIGLDTYSPYHDTRPNLVAGQPEDRHYRAYFADRDQPVGDWSDIATIAVRG